jgi:hypothetical protein
MIKKIFLFEDDDSNEEKSDYQKILEINKKKLSPYDVDFFDSEGNSYEGIIEVRQDGLHFTFDGLAEYLQFFFKEYYEEGSDGEYDAQNYESMYNGNWGWWSDFSDRTYDDWREGYVVDYFTYEQLSIVKEIAKYLSSEVYNSIELKNGKVISKDTDKITNLLEILGLEDAITDAYIDASVLAVENEVPEGIEKSYCNCLDEIGIERYSDKYCFWKYELSWGSAIMLFARFGEPDDLLLDLLFKAVERANVNHLPEYYEMQHQFWDGQAFNEYWNNKVTSILENELENIKDNTEQYNLKFFKLIDEIQKLGGTETWIYSKNKKYSIKINKVDDKNLQITYQFRKLDGGYDYKMMKTSFEYLLNLLNTEPLFDLTKDDL